MAYPADFRETFVAAVSEATDILRVPTGLVDAVYTQYSSNYGGPGKGETVNITIPAVSVANATNITSSGVTGIAPADTKTAIAINSKWSSNRKIQEYDDTLSASDLASVYIAPIVEEVVQRLDIELGALVTAGNFNVHTPISGGGADLLTRANIADAYGLLRSVGCPIDTRNSFIALNPIVYAKTVSATEFSQESTVGIRSAEAAQQDARAMPAMRFRWVESNGMTATTGVYKCLAAHRYAIGLRAVTPKLRTTEHVQQSVIFPTPGKNVGVVVESWYEPKDQARYIHAFVMCGYSVVRPNMGVLINTA